MSKAIDKLIATLTYCILYCIYERVTSIFTMTSHRFQRARRLLLRAVELFGNEEEHSNVDAPCSSSRQTCVTSRSRSSFSDQSRHDSGSHSALQAPYAASSSRPLSQTISSFGLGRESTESTQQRPTPPAQLRESCLDHASRNREGQRLFGFNPRTPSAARKRRKTELDELFLKGKSKCGPEIVYV